MKLAVLLAIVGLVAGCATRPAAPVRSASPDTWEARGRLAIEALQNDPRLTSGQGNFRWRQTGELATIRLSGPFGAGATEIEWSPTRVVVRAADGTVTAANEGPDAAQLLLTERLGFSWPLSSARCWLRGESCPDAPASRWQVRYDAWWPRDDGRLPRRLTLEDDALRIRIVVDAWEP